MKFDSNLAWREATRAVSANRDVLLALAGVFFMLPGLAFTVFYPQPEPAAGMSQEALIKLVQGYYLTAAPVLVAVMLLQAVGTLSVLTLFTDRTRPTVGEAIRLGVSGLLSYVGAQLMLALAIVLVSGFVLSLAAVTGVQAIAVVLGIMLAIGTAYAGIKTSLVAPIVAVERERNPVEALRRSWQLTRGNSVRLALFYLLVVVAFVVVLSLVMMVVGVVLRFAVEAETGRVIAAVVSSAIGATMTVFLTAILAAAHRQLAGPSPDVVGNTFS